MTETRPHDVAAIKGVLESHYKAWDAGDADAFVTDYAEDATVIMPGIYRKSREEVRQGMAEGFASFLKGSTAIDKLGTISRTPSGRSRRHSGLVSPRRAAPSRKSSLSLRIRSLTKSARSPPRGSAVR